MLHKSIHAALGTTLVLILATAAEAGREGSLGGTVVNEQGEKLEGVVVTVFSSEETRTGTTNKKGRFRLMVMDATQSFTMRLEREGYLPQEGPIQLAVGSAVNLTWTMVAVPSEGAETVEGSNEAVALYNEGASAFNAGDYAMARSRFEEALSHEPAMLAAQKVLMLVYFQQQEWELAASTAERVMGEEPDNDVALKIGFDSSSQIGQGDRAVVFLDQLVESRRDSDTAARVFNQGVAEMRAGAVDEARRRFEQAISIEPSLGAAYNGLAMLHLQAEEFEPALNTAERLLEIDPGNAEALGIRYEVYRRTGDETKMKAALEELQSADPDRIVEAFFQQGVLMFNEGNPEGAIEAFQRVLSADPENARAYYELGRSYLSAGDMNQAKEALQTFLTMAPNDPEAPSAKEMLGYLE